MISDDTLTLYFYDDGLTSEEKRVVEAALGADPLLAARYAVLCRQFQQWREPDTPPAPEHLHHRWHDIIAGMTASMKPRGWKRRKPENRPDHSICCRSPGAVLRWRHWRSALACIFPAPTPLIHRSRSLWPVRHGLGRTSFRLLLPGASERTCATVRRVLPACRWTTATTGISC